MLLGRFWPKDRKTAEWKKESNGVQKWRTIF